MLNIPDNAADPVRLGFQVDSPTVVPGRRSDLWSGVGLACAYAGGVPRSALATLAGPRAPDLAQGVSEPAHAPDPAYEVWRRRTRELLAPEGAAA